jgi:hypothetical protein
MSPTYYGDGRWRAGALALETVIPFFKGFKELVRTYFLRDANFKGP